MVKAEGTNNLTDEVRIHFRDELRDARAVALRNVEDCTQIVVAIERLGQFLREEQSAGLGKYKGALNRIVRDGGRDLDDEFSPLFDTVCKGRNAAVHEGVFARTLTANTTGLAIILEDALMAKVDLVGAFMVRNPVCGLGWQPLSLVRHTLLTNSFSYLPVNTDGHWCLLSDFSLARYLREGEMRARLQETLDRALEHAIDKRIQLHEALLCKQNVPVTEALRECKGLPVLVTTDDYAHLLGIATPFDLL